MTVWRGIDLEKKRTVFLVCLIVVLVVSLFGVRLLLSIERPQGEEYKLAAEQLLSEAREEFKTIRSVSVREVVLDLVNKSWVLKNWGVAYIDPEETAMQENIYKALFMVPQDTNLTAVQLEWTGMFRAAKWNGKIYVVEENFDITEEFKAKSTFVHELTHIMQETYSLPTRTTFDGTKALTSLKEGDATLMVDTFENDGVVPPLAEVAVSGTSSLPDSINKLNRYVYRYGVEFVKALYHKGGWGTVNNAYLNPPNTTEQIMHPEKYFAQEDAKTVEAPSLADGWSLMKTDRFGEYFIFVMLDNWLPDDNAKEAAEGWDGDTVSYYEKDDNFLFTWNIVWDSEEDAYDFYSNFNDMLYEASAEKHNCSYWSNYGRYISIKWNENSTLIISSDNETLVQELLIG